MDTANALPQLPHCTRKKPASQPGLLRMLPPHTCMPRAARRLPTTPLPLSFIALAVSRRSGMTGSEGNDGVAGVRIRLPGPRSTPPPWVGYHSSMHANGARRRRGPLRKSPRHMATGQPAEDDGLSPHWDGWRTRRRRAWRGTYVSSKFAPKVTGPLLVLSIQLYMPEHYLIHRS
jgi:hypothetical protein